MAFIFKYTYSKVADVTQAFKPEFQAALYYLFLFYFIQCCTNMLIFRRSSLTGSGALRGRRQNVLVAPNQVLPMFI